MRTFIDGNGQDATAAANAYLATHRELTMADLYVIRTAPNYSGQYLDRTFLLTDYPIPLRWNYKGTFVTAVIERSEIESKIGTEADILTVTWSPQLSDVLATDDGGKTLLTVLQAFGKGIFDNGTLEVWRCLMPAPGTMVGSPLYAAPFGDCNIFGAYLLFSGRIGDLSPDRIKVEITVNSRLELLNQQIPTNLIEPTNILAQYSAGTRPANGPLSFTLQSGTTAQKLIASGSASGYVPAEALYSGGYVIISTGKLAGSYRGIQRQTIEDGNHVFYLYEPLPFTPVAGDTLKALIAVPTDQTGAKENGDQYQGFRFVPTPINSSVVIG